MAPFTIVRTVDVPLAVLWAAATDWGGYARWFPATRMRLDPPPVRVGWSFTGITGVGRAALHDSMVVTEYHPPTATGSVQIGDQASFAIRKTGRVLGGWARVSVKALGPHTSLLQWVEEIVVNPAPLGRAAAPVSDRVNEAMFSRVIDQMVAEALAAHDLGSRTGR